MIIDEIKKERAVKSSLPGFSSDGYFYDGGAVGGQGL